MIDWPIFKNFVYWYESPGDTSGNDLPHNNEPSIREWLFEQGLQYEVVVEGGSGGDTRDIGENTIGRWSSYASRGVNSDGHYFFEEETDVMAFKLKFL